MVTITLRAGQQLLSDMVGRTLKDGCEQSMLCILQYDAGYRIEWYSGARLCGAPTLRWLYSFPTCPAASNSGRNPKDEEILFFATEMSPLDLNLSKKLRNSSFFFFSKFNEYSKQSSFEN